MMFCPSYEKQGCTKKYDELKLINHVQTSEILLIEKFYLLSIHWSNVYTYRQNLALNNLQRLIRHKTQPTNQPTTHTAAHSQSFRLVNWYRWKIRKDHIHSGGQKQRVCRNYGQQVILYTVGQQQQSYTV